MQGGVETVEFWSPMKGVLNALKNIHEGKRLTLRDEAFLQCLYHEIQHTWQQSYAEIIKKLTIPEKELVEAINDWTARRNYYFFLRKLGVNPIMSKEMWKRGYAYQQHVSNFDALLAHLEITHSKVLQSLLDDLTVSLITDSPKDFNKHVSRVLRKLANKDKPHIAKTLEQLETALKYIAEPTFMEAFK